MLTTFSGTVGGQLRQVSLYFYQVISFMLQVQTVSHLVYIELLYIHKTTHSVKTQNIANVRIWRKTKTSVTIRAWAIFPWGIANLTLYIEYEKPSWGKQEQAPLLHPRVRSQLSSRCVCQQLVTVQSIRWMGSKHAQFGRINMPTGESSPFLKIRVCVLTSVRHFHSMECLFDIHFHTMYAISCL
jgi:hypothetical protein